VEHMKRVLVYRETLLPISETFIKAQTESMTRYRACYAGLLRASPSLPLDGEQALLVRKPSVLTTLRLKLYRKFGFAPAYKRLIASWGVGLVHAHFGPDGVNAMRLARFLKVPLIVTLHGYDVTTEQPFEALYGELWKEADLFLCVSDFMRRTAIERGFPDEKLKVHFIGVDTEEFRVRNRSRSKDSRKVLFVGRLSEKKCCRYLLDAMHMVQAAIPEADLTIIGDGPLRVSLEAQAQDLGVRCSFLGAQDSSTIRRHMEESALFCAPSVRGANGDSEGFGIVFLEAQAAGVPVVSFRHGGIPEAVEDGVTALLAPEGDSAALAHNILFYLQDPALARAAGLAGERRANQEFELKRQTAALEVIYDDLLRERAGRR